MAERSRTLPWALLAVLALLLSACGAGEQPAATLQGQADDDALHGRLLPEETQYQVPAIELTDTSGAPYTLAEDTEAPLTLVFFGYTHCPDICQVVMSSLASAMTRLDEAQREQVGMVFVTTDPARDDAATLRSYLDNFDPSFTGLTGDLDKIIALGKPMAIGVAQGKKLPTGGYEVDHTASVLGIRDGEVEAIWSQSTSAAQFAEDIVTLLAHGTGQPQDGDGS